MLMRRIKSIWWLGFGDFTFIHIVPLTQLCRGLLLTHARTKDKQCWNSNINFIVFVLSFNSVFFSFPSGKNVFLPFLKSTKTLLKSFNAFYDTAKPIYLKWRRQTITNIMKKNWPLFLRKNTHEILWSRLSSLHFVWLNHCYQKNHVFFFSISLDPCVGSFIRTVSHYHRTKAYRH